MEDDLRKQFLSSLTSSLQHLCNGCTRYEKYVSVTGHLYVSIDSVQNMEYVISEKMCKTEDNVVNFTSNSFLQPQQNYVDGGNYGMRGKYEQIKKEPAVFEPQINITFSKDSPTSFSNDMFGDINNATELMGQGTENDGSCCREISKSKSFLNQSVFPARDLALDTFSSFMQVDGLQGECAKDAVLSSNLKNDSSLDKIITTAAAHQAMCGSLKQEESDGQKLTKRAKRHKEKDRRPNYTCDICNKTFVRPGSLQIHVRSHTGERPFVCNICGKSFASKAILRSHKWIHSTVKRFTCETCGKSFERPSGLEKHKLLHTGNRPFACDKCDKTFTNKFSLKFHKYTHDEIKRFNCDRCPMGFAFKSGLENHMRIHTGFDPFMCDVCGKGFGSKKSLQNHSSIHSNVKAFECDVCHKTFRNHGFLKRHYKLHTGEGNFKCNICDKTFADGGHLRNHILTHTGEKPHVCNFCGDRFARSDYLTAHKRRHTGERPYACDVCGKRFTQSGAMHLHRRKHGTQKQIVKQEASTKTSFNESLIAPKLVALVPF